MEKIGSTKEKTFVTISLNSGFRVLCITDDGKSVNEALVVKDAHNGEVISNIEMWAPDPESVILVTAARLD